MGFSLGMFWVLVLFVRMCSSLSNSYQKKREKKKVKLARKLECSLEDSTQNSELGSVHQCTCITTLFNLAK